MMIDSPFRVDKIYRIEDHRVLEVLGEIEVVHDTDEQFVDLDDIMRPIMVSGVHPSDLALDASFVGLSEDDSSTEPYFVTSRHEDFAMIVPVQRIVRDPGSYAQGELKESLLSVPDSELSRFGVASLLEYLHRHNLR